MSTKEPLNHTQFLRFIFGLGVAAGIKRHDEFKKRTETEYGINVECDIAHEEFEQAMNGIDRAVQEHFDLNVTEDEVSNIIKATRGGQ